MTRTPESIRGIASGAIVLSMFLWAASTPAKAAPDPTRVALGGSCRAMDSAEALIDRQHGGTIAITVTPDRMSYVSLPGWIRLREVRYIEEGIEFAQVTNGVEIIPRSGIALDLVTTVRLRTDPGAPPVIVELHLTANPEQYTRLVSVDTEPRETKCQRMVQPYIDEAVERQLDERLEDHTRKAVMAVTAQLLARASYSPRAPIIDRTTPLVALPGPAAWLQTDTSKVPRTDFLWTFVVENPGMGGLPLVAVVLRRQDGKERYPHVELDSAAGKSDGVLAVIPGEGRVTGIVQIPGADFQKEDVLTLEFLGPDRQRLAFTTANGFEETARVKLWVGEPLTDEELRRRKEEQERIAEEREERRRNREAKRVSLAVMGSYGAIWLPAGMIGVDGQEDIRATSVKSFGVRVTKGLTPLWAVEVDVVGATSGTAEFPDVNGMGDNLTRTAKLGRLSFGGVLRLGERIVPHMRLGLGLQLVSRDSAMMTGNSSADGPGSGTDFTETLTFGAGVDWRLSDQMTAGIGLSVVRPGDQDLLKRTVEGGAHVSYAWNP